MGECLTWVGGLTGGGYGTVRVGDSNIRVHRLAYEGCIGEIPDGYVIHHTCNNQLCINPKHLQLMTRAEHSKVHSKDRVKTHCIHGHEFNAENTAICRGQQVCKACARERSRKHRAMGGGCGTR